MAAIENREPVVNLVGDVVATAGSILGARRIADYELVYFPAGTKTVYELEGKPIFLNVPCFVLTKPEESHRYLFDPDEHVRHLFVHFDYEALRQEDERFSRLLREGPMLPLSSNSLVPSLLKQMLQVAHNRSFNWKHRISALAAAALEELCAITDSATEDDARSLPVQIARAIAYMEENIAEPLTIESIAQQSGWSHEHFTRMFVATVGISPKRALLERRMKLAEKLMMSLQWTVKQIAYKVGYKDEHHFSKMYKLVRGITASAYIERCKDPVFRHLVATEDPDTPYPINTPILLKE